LPLKQKDFKGKDLNEIKKPTLFIAVNYCDIDPVHAMNNLKPGSLQKNLANLLQAIF